MEYSADEKKKYDTQNAVALSLSGLANDNISRVHDAQAKPFNYDGMTPLETSYGANNPFAFSAGPQAGGTQGNVQAGPMQMSIAGAGGASAIGAGEAGKGVQNDLNYGGLAKLPGVDDFSGDAQRTQDAVYQKAASRLNPQFQQRESDMRSRLAAQGISENSDAYRRELDNEGRTRNDAYDQAQYSAINAGSAEQSRIFGLAMNARQQGQNEVDTQGTFHNGAQGQTFDQKLAASEQAMKAQGQNFDQFATAGKFANDAQQQQFGQGMANADLYNSSEAQKFQQGQAAAALGNTTHTAYDNESAAKAGFNNNSRQQQIQEASYLRNLPLNDIAALLGTGGGVNQPDFNPVSQVGVAAPDYMGMVNNNYGQAVNQYNTRQQARSQMMGSIFGAAGSVGSAFALSDKRFKENARRIGTLANGIATYTFNYIGDKILRFGVMAQEVLEIRPDAVVNINGVLHVNYGKVF